MSDSGSSFILEDYTNIHDGFYIKESQMLGGGSYACVYKGYDEKQKQSIAVKHIKKYDYMKFKDLLQRQIDIMKKLKHLNIIQFYGHHLQKQDGLFLFIQLCQKDNMRKKILQKLKEQETYAYFTQLVDGMTYMNSQKIFHRDLKPENLLVTKEKKLKIADFGIARQFMQNQVQYTKMRCTQYYSAPEILLDYAEYDQKCDVYSAGYVLYEMLTCQKIFQKYMVQGKSLTKVLREVKQKGGWVFDHPSLINKPFWTNLLKGMLQFDPQKRITFFSIKQLLNTLKPTDRLPIFRTISQQEQYDSHKKVELIKRLVQFKTYKVNFPINVVRVMNHSQYCKSQFIPRIYKLGLLYVSLTKYCFLASSFIEQLNKREQILSIGQEMFQDVFKVLLIQHKSMITKYLDDLAIKLNKGKQQMKTYLIKHILTELKQIINMKQKLIQLRLIEKIPQLVKDILQFQQKHEQIHCLSYENQIKAIVDMCYITDAQVNSLGEIDLKIYIILLMIRNSKILMDQKQYKQNNLPPNFRILLNYKKQELIKLIVLLNRQKIEVPKWIPLTIKNSLK